MIDAVGRRRLFITMALGMCIVLVLEGVCVAIDNWASNIAAVVFVFAFESCFTWGTLKEFFSFFAGRIPSYHEDAAQTLSLAFLHNSSTFILLILRLNPLLGWMATVWVFPAEILPLKIRAKGAALAAAADFVGNFLVRLIIHLILMVFPN